MSKISLHNKQHICRPSKKKSESLKVEVVDLFLWFRYTCFNIGITIVNCVKLNDGVAMRCLKPNIHVYKADPMNWQWLLTSHHDPPLIIYTRIYQFNVSFLFNSWYLIDPAFCMFLYWSCIYVYRHTCYHSGFLK